MLTSFLSSYIKKKKYRIDESVVSFAQLQLLKHKS